VFAARSGCAANLGGKGKARSAWSRASRSKVKPMTRTMKAVIVICYLIAAAIFMFGFMRAVSN